MASPTELKTLGITKKIYCDLVCRATGEGNLSIEVYNSAVVQMVKHLYKINIQFYWWWRPAERCTALKLIKFR